LRERERERKREREREEKDRETDRERGCVCPHTGSAQLAEGARHLFANKKKKNQIRKPSLRHNNIKKVNFYIYVLMQAAAASGRGRNAFLLSL
jgi:hypothetical protein